MEEIKTTELIEEKVFSTIKFIEAEGIRDYKVHNGWIDKCDGMPVVNNVIFSSNQNFGSTNSWEILKSEWKPYRELDNNCVLCETEDGISKLKTIGVRIEDSKASFYFCGGYNKTEKEERFKYCPKCGKEINYGD
jgi:hypothetical protein